MSDESHHEKELGGQLLASVSRSFYLTLKALPRELREPLSLAYLLARTADTIADTTDVPSEIRLECLSLYDGLIQQPRSLDEQPLATELAVRFRPRQTDAAEALLMQRFAEALAWLRTMQGGVMTSIQSVLKTIVEGQRRDILRFPGPGDLRSLQTPAELEDYTYLVAGCVGEFWTQLCFSELPNAFVAGVSERDACAWGIRFGKGLQLVNILRDIGKDARLGRCYLPEEQWQNQGLTLAGIQADPWSLEPVWRGWMQQCEDHLAEGLRYAQALRHGRLRYATALPLLLAVRTLARLKKASRSELQAGVKVSRMEMTALLAKLTLANSPEGIARLYDQH